MRIVFISSSLPPFSDSQTVRSRQLIAGAVQAGCQVRYIAPGTVSASPGSDQWPAERDVVRTPPSPFIAREYALRHLPGAARWQWAYRNVAYRLARPDLFAGWELLATRTALALYERWPYDVIVSASGSMTAHMAAAALAAGTGKPWVADYGDPWHILDRDHRPWLARWSAVAEPRALRHAAAIVLTTDATRQAYADWLGDRLPRAEVIPYGYSAADLTWPSHEPAAGRMVVSHIGAAHTSDRPLQPLIAAAGKVAARHPEGIELHIIGNHSPAFDEAVAQCAPALRAELRQRVSFAESLEWMQRADVLVVVGNVSRLQLPGKLYMCLAAPRPLLYIGQGDDADDPGVHLLRGLPGVVTTTNNAEAIRKALIVLQADLPALQAASVARAQSPDVTRFEVSAVGEQFLKLLRTVAA